jgi:hypothetical protein
MTIFIKSALGKVRRRPYDVPRIVSDRPGWLRAGREVFGGMGATGRDPSMMRFSSTVGEHLVRAVRASQGKTSFFTGKGMSLLTRHFPDDR